MKKKYIALLLAISISAATLFSGCSISINSTSSTSSVSSASISSDNLSELLGSDFTGTIDSIDGNTITLSIGGGPQGMEKPEDSNNENSDGTDTNAAPPEKPDNSNSDSADSNSTPPEKPDTNNSDSTGSNNTPPEKPENNNSENTDNNSTPEKPSNDGSDSSENNESTNSQTNNETSDESDTNTSDNNDSSSDKPSDAPDDAFDFSAASTTTATITITDESILTDADGNGISVSDLKEGDHLKISLDDNGNVTSISLTNDAMGPSGDAPGQESGGVDSYDAVTEYSEDTTEEGQTYTSTGTDENAVLISGGEVKLNSATITRTSDDSTGGDNSSFYGVGASLLVKDGTAYIDNASITSAANGAAGVFSYNNGTAYVQNSTIKTTNDTSGGIHVAGGGTLYAWNLNVETEGESSAAIRSDRGSGTMVVDGGSYTSKGTGSPAVYSTADITVNEATLTAEGSEAVCIEGLNTLRLFNCDLTGNMKDDEQNDCTWTVILYQSMSGDSEEGNSTFSMTDGTLTSNNGGLFYTTNTESTFYLNNVDITSSSDSEFFLRCTGNNNQRGWGSSGSNGADCSFTADNQEMNGNIIYDSISNLNFYMENGSVLTGSIIDDETYAGNGGNGEASLYISKDSKWVVTGDSTLTSLYNEGTIVDENGKTVSIVGSDGTVYVQGDSSYTVTVQSYETTADFSNASTSDSFENYSVENPFS